MVAPLTSGAASSLLRWLTLAGLVVAALSLSVGRQVESPPSLWVLWLAASPVWTLALGIAAAVSCVRRPQDAVQWGVLVGVVGLWGLVWGRAWWASPVDPAHRDTVRVMSWNVQRLGFEDRDDGENLACVVAGVEALDPDLVTFLEVTGRDVDRLEAALDLDCSQIDYRGTGRPDRGGLATCARGETWQLGRAGPRRFTQDTDWYFSFGEMVRTDGRQVVNLIAVHLQPNALHLRGPRSPGVIAETHQREAAALLERMQHLQDPTIVAGDFNSTREAPLHGALRDVLVDTFEAAAWGPGSTVTLGGFVPLRVDYIYATADLPAVYSETPGSSCSDHAPVLSELALPVGWYRGSPGE